MLCQLPGRSQIVDYHRIGSSSLEHSVQLYEGNTASGEAFKQVAVLIGYRSEEQAGRIPVKLCHCRFGLSLPINADVGDEYLEALQSGRGDHSAGKIRVKRVCYVGEKQADGICPPAAQLLGYLVGAVPQVFRSSEDTIT
jgi:hypothetical protein